MSYRIHRVMGWGMTWNDFEMATTLDCEGHETSDALDRVLSAATDEDLTVPKDVRSLSWSTRHVNAIFDDRLLALDIDFIEEVVEGTDGAVVRERVPPKLAQGNDLCTVTMTPDDLLHVIFFPNATTAKRWTHFDNDLDYAFEQYRDGDPGRDGGVPRDFAHFMRFNPYPFTSFLMDKDGKPLEWQMFSQLDEAYPDGWFPAVPSEIRWWTQKLGIFDDAGVNKLRPILAQYWC